MPWPCAPWQMLGKDGMPNSAGKSYSWKARLSGLIVDPLFEVMRCPFFFIFVGFAEANEGYL